MMVLNAITPVRLNAPDLKIEIIVLPQEIEIEEFFRLIRAAIAGIAIGISYYAFPEFAHSFAGEDLEHAFAHLRRL